MDSSGGLGYWKRGRTFNRRLDSGLIHVINFQIARNWQYKYGCFAVNLGVFIPAVHATITGREAPGFVQEYDCEIRQRLGCLLSPAGKDVWWDLALDADSLSETVRDALREHGLPYLDRFLTPADIVREWREHGQSTALPPRAGLSVAILLDSEGNTDQAQRLLQQEYARATSKYRHRHYAALVKEVAERMGIAIPG